MTKTFNYNGDEITAQVNGIEKLTVIFNIQHDFTTLEHQELLAKQDEILNEFLAVLFGGIDTEVYVSIVLNVLRMQSNAYYRYKTNGGEYTEIDINGKKLY